MFAPQFTHHNFYNDSLNYYYYYYKILKGHFTLSIGGKSTESNNFSSFYPFGQGFITIKLLFDQNI